PVGGERRARGGAPRGPPRPSCVGLERAAYRARVPRRILEVVNPGPVLWAPADRVHVDAEVIAGRGEAGETSRIRDHHVIRLPVDLRDLGIRAEVPPEARRRSRTGRELRTEVLAELEHGRVSRPRRRIRGRELKTVWLDVDAEEGRDHAWSDRWCRVLE